MGQETGCQLVATLGDAHRDLDIGPAVHLGGTAGAWATPPRRAAIVGVEETFVDQPVEVELRDVMGNSDCCGRLFPSDRFLLCDHEAVQVAPDRVREHTDAAEPVVEVGHASNRYHF
jgi:hypothetical protein